MAGCRADGPAKGRAPMIGTMGGLATLVIGVMEIQAARLPAERPAMPGPVSKALLWAQWAHLTSA